MAAALKPGEAAADVDSSSSSSSSDDEEDELLYPGAPRVAGAPIAADQPFYLSSHSQRRLLQLMHLIFDLFEECSGATAKPNIACLGPSPLAGAKFELIRGAPEERFRRIVLQDTCLKVCGVFSSSSAGARCMDRWCLCGSPCRQPCRQPCRPRPRLPMHPPMHRPPAHLPARLTTHPPAGPPLLVLLLGGAAAG